MPKGPLKPSGCITMNAVPHSTVAKLCIIPRFGGGGGTDRGGREGAGRRALGEREGGREGGSTVDTLSLTMEDD